MSRIDLGILRRPAQSLTRKAYVVPGTEVSILGSDVDAIGADSLGITAVFMLIFLCLWNQVFTFIVWIPADPVQEGKAITHGDTNLPQAKALRARAPNSIAALALPRAMGRTCL